MLIPQKNKNTIQQQKVDPQKSDTPEPKITKRKKKEKTDRKNLTTGSPTKSEHRE